MSVRTMATLSRLPTACLRPARQLTPVRRARGLVTLLDRQVLPEPTWMDDLPVLLGDVPDRSTSFPVLWKGFISP